MKNFTLAVIASAVLLGSAVAANAQAGGLEVAAGGGWVHYHDKETASAGGFSASDSGSSNKGKFDASVGYYLTNHVDVGFEYGYSKLQGSTSNGYISGTYYTANESDSLNTYGGFMHFGFGPRHVQPYIVIGGGAARVTDTVSVSGGGLSASTSASTNGGYGGGGLGINFRYGHFGVRPEVRYNYLGFSQNVEGASVEDNINSIQATGTVFYTFGGRGEHEHHHHNR